MDEHNKKVIGFTAKQTETEDGIDFSFETIGKTSNSQVIMMCLLSLMTVIDDRDDDDREIAIDMICNIIHNSSLNNLLAMYQLISGVIQDDYDDDEIQN